MLQVHEVAYPHKRYGEDPTESDLHLVMLTFTFAVLEASLVGFAVTNYEVLLGIIINTFLFLIVGAWSYIVGG